MPDMRQSQSRPNGCSCISLLAASIQPLMCILLGVFIGLTASEYGFTPGQLQHPSRPLLFPKQANPTEYACSFVKQHGFDASRLRQACTAELGTSDASALLSNVASTAAARPGVVPPPPPMAAAPAPNPRSVASVAAAARSANVDHLKVLMDRLKSHKELRDVTSSSYKGTKSTPMKRTKGAEKKFESTAVDQVAAAVANRIVDEDLAVLFYNCFPNTLDTTVRHFDQSKPDVFIITGDIDAQWLRDSTNQVLPYVPFANNDPKLKALLCGLIRRQSADILIDPYANAFNYGMPTQKSQQGWQNDQRVPAMTPHLHEGKYELDSLAAMLKLSYRFFNYTQDISCFDYVWAHAVQLIVDTVVVQQRGTDEEDKANDVRYSFKRNGRELHHGGRGAPAARCGLSKMGFRPSDDACDLPFLIPSNAMIVVELRHAAEILDQLVSKKVNLWPPAQTREFETSLYSGLAPLNTAEKLASSKVDLVALAKRARDLANEIDDAIWKHAAVKGPDGKFSHLAYEVDCKGGQKQMDDANIPSLLSLPYLGYIAKDNSTYLSTRSFVWSKKNPWYFEGKAANGIGGPHIGRSMIWPMSLIMRALTSTDEQEIKQSLEWIKTTHAGKGLLHESFNQDNPSRFTRAWFAWTNTLLGELILSLVRERPHILF